MKSKHFENTVNLKDVEIPAEILSGYLAWLRNQAIVKQNLYYQEASQFKLAYENSFGVFVNPILKQLNQNIQINSAEEKVKRKVLKYLEFEGLNRIWPKKAIDNLSIPGSNQHLLYGQPMDINGENDYAIGLLTCAFVASTSELLKPNKPVVCMWNYTFPRALIPTANGYSWINEELNIPVQHLSDKSENLTRQAYATAVQFCKIQKDIIAVGFEGGIIEVWALGSIENISRLPSYRERPIQFRVPLCRSCDANIDIRLLENSDFLSWDKSAITCLAWHPSLMLLCSGSCEGPVCVWKFYENSKSHTPNSKQRFCKKFDIDSDHFGFGDHYKIKMIHKIWPEGLSCVCSMAWHLKDSTLSIGTQDGTLGIWDYNHANNTKINSRNSNNPKNINRDSYSPIIACERDIFPEEYRTFCETEENLLTLRFNESCEELSPKYTNYVHSAKDNSQKTKYMETDILGQEPYSNPTEKIWFKEKKNSEYLKAGVIGYLKEAHAGAISSLIWNIHDHTILLTGGDESDGCINLWRVSEIGTIIPLFSISVRSKVTSFLWNNLTKELLTSHSIDQEVTCTENLCESTISTENITSVIIWRYCPIEECIFKIVDLGSNPLINGELVEPDSQSTKSSKRNNAYCLIQSADGSHVAFWSLPSEQISIWAMPDVKLTSDNCAKSGYGKPLFSQPFHIKMRSESERYKTETEFLRLRKIENIKSFR